MTRALILVFLVSPLAYAAPAPEEPPSPPPVPIRARLVEGKVQIETTSTVVVNRPEQRTVTVIENGVAVTKTYTVVVPIYQTEKRVITVGDDLMVFDTTGARVAPNRAAELLREFTDVLLSADGKLVNSSHLKKAKAGTLVLVIPSYKALFTPATPQPPEPPPPPPVEKKKP